MPSHKSFTPRFKSAGDDGTASWVMATLNVVDSDGDVSLPGSFGKQAAMILPAHDRWHVPLGKAEVSEDGDEVLVKARFNLDIPAARDWHSAIKFDLENPPALQEYSYGYDLHPGGWKTGEFQGRQVRFFTPKADGSPGVQVHETSPVLKGAGVGTRTLAAKRAKELPGGRTVEDIRDLLRAALRESNPDADYVWVRDFTDEWVVYEAEGDPGAFRAGYTVADDGAVSLGEPVEVVAQTVYEERKSRSSVMTFSEQVDAALAVVDPLVTRASEVVALRAQKGKGISSSSAERLARLHASLGRLKGLAPPPPDTGDIDALYAQSLALIQGA